MIARPLWAMMGILALALGAVGMFLPFLPTVPFLLAAGFCFGRSSEQLHRWLLAHPVFGPPIHAWNERGAIPRRAKHLASLSIAAAFLMSLLMGFGPIVLAVQAVTLAGVALFVWTRPD
jgi:uncharacterized membrane protein YbaN (DUF454 family)